MSKNDVFVKMFIWQEPLKRPSIEIISTIPELMSELLPVLETAGFADAPIESFSYGYSGQEENEMVVKIIYAQGTDMSPIGKHHAKLIWRSLNEMFDADEFPHTVMDFGPVKDESA